MRSFNRAIKLLFGCYFVRAHWQIQILLACDCSKHIRNNQYSLHSWHLLWMNFIFHNFFLLRLRTSKLSFKIVWNILCYTQFVLRIYLTKFNRSSVPVFYFVVLTKSNQNHRFSNWPLFNDIQIELHCFGLLPLWIEK